MRFSCIFPKHLARNCTSPARFRCENTAGKGVKRQEMWDNPTPYTLSYTQTYTQTYTRKYQSLLGFSIPGVGSVGDFQKTFFWGGERKNVETSSTRRRTGIPKHRTSLHKTSVLLRQNLRTFAQRSPMFLISEKRQFSIRMVVATSWWSLFVKFLPLQDRK